MKLLFVGPLWEGSTALQRARAMSALNGIHAVELDSMERVGRASLTNRIRHRLRWPADPTALNTRLLAAVACHRPDVVLVDSSRVLARSTIRRVKHVYGARAVYYSPDDVSQPHNSSRQLELCDRDWDIFFTTKSFNVPELRARGVVCPLLIGKSYDPAIHRPMSPAEVGEEYEHFDVVFSGTCENDRLRSINRIAEAGYTIVVYGNGWSRRSLHPTIELRSAAYATAYTRTLHTGKIALCFLRKINRDKVTQRSVEIPAAGRPMVAEKTEEHDTMFVAGREYVSFEDDASLVTAVGHMVADEPARQALARAGRERCERSGYSTIDRAREMIRAIENLP